MRKLDLGDWKGDSKNWSGLRLVSFMAHPDNETFREEYLAWLVVAEVYRRKKKGREVNNWLAIEFEKCGNLERLLYAPSQIDVMARALKSMRKAKFAGEMVFVIIQCHNDPKAPKIGVNGAAKLLESILHDSPNHPDKIKSRTIKKYWTEFKQVSHLWCALKMLYKLNPNELIPVGNIPPPCWP